MKTIENEAARGGRGGGKGGGGAVLGSNQSMALHIQEFEITFTFEDAFQYSTMVHEQNPEVAKLQSQYVLRTTRKWRKRSTVKTMTTCQIEKRL